MMNYIWGLMIIFSIIYAVITNNLDKLTNSIFESTSQATTLTITMFGLITLWTGIMNILSKTNLINILSKIISPIISRIFNNIKKDSEEYNYICMNFTANLLGLGNASTPLGLKAVKELNKKNNTSAILKLILINTAAIQLIPSTIIGLRTLLGSLQPNSIIVPIWLCSITSLLSALIMYKFLNRKEN